MFRRPPGFLRQKLLIAKITFNVKEVSTVPVHEFKKNTKIQKIEGLMKNDILDQW